MKEPDRINYNLGNKRRVLMRPAVQKVPWYSLARDRNILILGVILGLLPFSKMFIDMFHGIKQGIRLQRTREEFIKELEMEELEEERANSK